MSDECNDATSTNIMICGSVHRTINLIAILFFNVKEMNALQLPVFSPSYKTVN